MDQVGRMRELVKKKLPSLEGGKLQRERNARREMVARN
jgi:hypothetical protein